MSLELESDLVTLAEAAKLLKISPVTVKRWMKQGRLPAYHVGPKAVRSRRAELATLLRPVARSEEAAAMKGMQPVQTGMVVPPLMDEAVQAGLEALAEAREATARMRERHGGRPLEPSWPIIRAAREERGRWR